MHPFATFVVFVAAAGSLHLAVAVAVERPTRTLPRASWHHPEGHHAERLFKRAVNAPPVGSPNWVAQYPDMANFPPQNIPQQWIDALDAAVAAGKIPDIPIPTMGPQGSPVYPNGTDPTSSQVCSATYQCRGVGDLWDAPPGTVALSFDDGPLPQSVPLYQFLKVNNVHPTHFFIGGNIRGNPYIFLQAFQGNQDPIAVHTYTHPYMTIHNNTDVVAELGYTMQIIYDSTGGRVPKFWRPPFGDVDNRVRAIAEEVFGLTTVIWNKNSVDWELSNGIIPLATVEANLASFYQGPKSPGLIILEHELSNGSVTAFIDTWPIMRSQNWKPISIPDAADIKTDPHHAWYQNSWNDVAPVVSMSFGKAPAGWTAKTSSASSSTGLSGSTRGTTTTTATGSGSSTTSTAPSTTKAGGAVAALRAPPGVLQYSSALLLGVAFLFTHFA